MAVNGSIHWVNLNKVLNAQLNKVANEDGVSADDNGDYPNSVLNKISCVVLDDTPKPPKSSGTGTATIYYQNVNFRVPVKKDGKTVNENYRSWYSKPEDNLILSQSVQELDSRMKVAKKSDAAVSIGQQQNPEFYSFIKLLDNIIEAKYMNLFETNPKLPMGKRPKKGSTPDFHHMYNAVYGEQCRDQTKVGQKRENPFVNIKIKFNDKGDLSGFLQILDVNLKKKVKQPNGTFKNVSGPLTADGEKLSPENIHQVFTRGSEIKSIMCSVSVSSHQQGVSIANNPSLILFNHIPDTNAEFVSGLLDQCASSNSADAEDDPNEDQDEDEATVPNDDDDDLGDD